MAKKRVKKVNKIKEEIASSDDSKLFAFLAAFLSIIGFIMALAVKRKDNYVMHYAKQSLVLFVAFVIVWVASLILVFIPILGWLVIWVAYVLLAILWIMSWLYALSGQMKVLPVIGKYASKFNL